MLSRRPWQSLADPSLGTPALDSLTFVAAALRASEYCERSSIDDLYASQAL